MQYKNRGNRGYFFYSKYQWGRDNKARARCKARGHQVTDVSVYQENMI